MIDPSQFGPQQAAPPQEAGADSADSGKEILKQIIALVSRYQDQEQSEQNLLGAEQVRTLVQKILANEEKSQDDLLQGKMSPAAIRGALGG